MGKGRYLPSWLKITISYQRNESLELGEFVSGTVSGAPKIRAMEIIHELEPCRRGPYSGVYGYYDFEGQLNSAITIRTMIVRPQGNQNYLVSVQAGAGLVADSEPEKEYEETLNKARGLLEAILCLI